MNAFIKSGVNQKVHQSPLDDSDMECHWVNTNVWVSVCDW